MAADLDAIEARLRGAQQVAPGPWKLRKAFGVHFADYGDPADDTERYDLADVDKQAFWEFITHTPEDLRALIREVRELRAFASSVQQEGAGRLD